MTTVSTKERQLRRKERELSYEQALEVIHSAPYAVISTADATGVPYGTPINPVFFNGAFYFHTTREDASRRNTNMLANPAVSLVFVSKAFILPHLYSVDFASAVVTGTVAPVEDPGEAATAMMALVKRYAPGNSDVRNAVQMQHRFSLVRLWKVTVDRIEGKARAAQTWQTGKTVIERTEGEVQTWLRGVAS